MYSYALRTRPHILTSTDITTINYTLEWPHLENPSNTTFAGPAQIDICRCPRLNPPSLNQKEEARRRQASVEQGDASNIEREAPGHIYTRYRCSGPEVQFKSATEQLWVLDAPHGPINMLRPATFAERELRRELQDTAEPAAYVGKNILLLTGPCPRGRYQAHATLQYLRSLQSDVRKHLERISLLIQPYEEDCVEESSRQAYSELAEYISQYLPGFRTLHLNVWDDEQRMRSVASEFSILLHRNGIEIAVGWNWCKGEAKHYTSARAFLEAMSIKEESRRDRGLKRGSLEEDLIMREDKEGEGDDTKEAHDTKDRDEDEDDDADFEDNESDEIQGGEGAQISGDQANHDDKRSVTSKSIQLDKSTSDTAEKWPNDTSRQSSQSRLIAHRHSGINTGQMISSEKDEKQDEDMDETRSSNEHDQKAAQSSECNNTARKQQEAPETSSGDGRVTDDDWTDAALSPVTPHDSEEGSWQVL